MNDREAEILAYDICDAIDKYGDSVIQTCIEEVTNKKIKFSLTLAINQLCKNPLLNLTDEGKQIICTAIEKGLGKKTEVHFNNTGSTFWIYL